MEQDDGCENEETASPSTGTTVVISSGEVGSSDASSNQEANVVLKQPLVPYAESSDDSNESSLVKRPQSDESEEVIEKKKRKAE